jgi:hypothetical protein
MVAYLLSKPNGSWKASMKVWVGLPAAAAVVVVFLIFAGVAALPAAMAAVVEHTFVVSSMHVCIHTYCTGSEQANYGNNVCTYAGEPSKSDALVQGDAGHRGERAAPGAGDRGHGGRLGGRPCRQQVAVQHDDPLVMDRSFLFPPNPSPSPSIDPSYNSYAPPVMCF